MATDSRLAARSFAVTASSKTALRRCHFIQLVEKAVDRRGLLGWIGDEVAHQIACAMDGLGAETLPKLADELLAQQLDLLSALHLDALQFRVGVGAKLLGDLLGVVPGLLDHLRRLGLGLFERLGMLGVGVGDLLFGLGMVGELSADSLLLVLHHGANRRHNVFPEQEKDDREPDELSDEGRHTRYRSRPVVTGTVRVVTSTPSTRLARLAASVSTEVCRSAVTARDCSVSSSLACWSTARNLRVGTGLRASIHDFPPLGAGLVANVCRFTACRSHHLEVIGIRGGS